MHGLLSFHAHPDDESISMGGTLAAYRAAGVAVTVVTATRGEEGEIHNRDDADEVRPRLGDIREEEARAACAVLGVDDLVFLGYRDSGMMGTPENLDPDAFWNADFMEAVGRLVGVIRSRRPAVITAYDPFGGYGHPDHIQVHRVGTAAYFGAADVGRFPVSEWGEPHQPAKLYWVTWARERMRRVRSAMATDVGEDEPHDEEPSSGTLADHITTSRDVTDWVGVKHLALLQHDTQFAADSWVRTLTPDRLGEVLGEEVFTRVHSTVDSDPGAHDLFDGVS
jgi:N-acetyl-1-D-myo-inositol-2-amino-2-deoxy-alpha-D-glucopyranoside deacetylase